jgi:hypothetical protein
MQRISIVMLALLSIVALSCSTAPNKAFIVDRKRGEVRCTGIVQKTKAPRMNDFGNPIPALLGSKGGEFENYFVFLTDAGVSDVNSALIELGAKSRLVYKLKDVEKHKGLRPDNTPADYMQGDPVQIYIEWIDNGKKKCLAYEDFFIEQTIVQNSKTTKPWTPHFIFHGSGVLNKKKTGCIACTHDCPGGIIGNNQYPLVNPIPVLKADWAKLPAPGTEITVILRPVPSGG